MTLHEEPRREAGAKAARLNDYACFHVILSRQNATEQTKVVGNQSPLTQQRLGSIFHFSIKWVFVSGRQQ
jgi:hypothetical protein